MKLGIMQPYFFPYIGYFQLMNAVDNFVVYDDVNYIKQGWVNRNRILLNNMEHIFTLNLLGASSFKLINQIRTGNNKEKLLKTVDQAYAKAPFHMHAMPMIKELLLNEETNLSKYIINSIINIVKYLGITSNITISSEIEKNNELRGQEKILHICKILRADTYINAIGGMNLYSKEKFHREGVELFFIKSNRVCYRQFENEFIPWLSIIDVMMFNPKERIKAMLDGFELI